MTLALDTLAYARRLREAGFSEQQAEGQAQALAAAMTDTLATKHDMHELEVRLDARFAATRHDLQQLETRIDARLSQVDARFESLEKRLDARLSQVDARFESLERHIDTRLSEQAARFDAKLSDLAQQLTMRMMLAVGAVSALVKLL